MGNLGKTIALVLILVFLTSLVILPPATVKAQSKTITVPDDYSDIQTAINHANNGDAVFVRAGIYSYNEQNSILSPPHQGDDYGIIVNKSISLIGENRNTVILINWQHGTARAVYIESDNVTFTGFTVKSNMGSKVGLDLGSLAFFGSNCKITNNNFQKTLVGTGINERISNCTFEGSDNFGVVVTLSNSIIADNIITGNYLGGIDISDSSNVTIKGNNITHNGVESYGSFAIEYDGSGISLTTYDQNVNTNINIYHNNISDNPRFGIQFYGATSNLSIYSNNITNNGIGINLSNLGLRKYSPLGSGTKIFYNNVVGNIKNAFIETTYPYNLTSDMLYNKVIGNGTDVVLWDNGVVGNYWSDYQSKYPNATEIGSSGIGNTPYIIDTNNTDSYPLIHQVDITAIAPTPTSSSTIGTLISPLTIPIIAITVVIFVVVISLLLYRRHRKTLI
jgi:parallel beta-helix repeat protein